MSSAFEVFVSILAAIGMFFYIRGQYSAGKNMSKGLNAQQANDTLDILKTRADAFRDELNDAKIEIQAQHDEIIRLQEGNKHKDQLIHDYLEIISNRNPDLEKVLGEVRNFLQTLNEKIGDSAKILIE